MEACSRPLFCLDCCVAQIMCVFWKATGYLISKMQSDSKSRHTQISTTYDLLVKFADAAAKGPGVPLSDVIRNWKTGAIGNAEQMLS